MGQAPVVEMSLEWNNRRSRGDSRVINIRCAVPFIKEADDSSLAFSICFIIKGFIEIIGVESRTPPLGFFIYFFNMNNKFLAEVQPFVTSVSSLPSDSCAFRSGRRSCFPARVEMIPVNLGRRLSGGTWITVPLILLSGLGDRWISEWRGNEVRSG